MSKQHCTGVGSGTICTGLVLSEVVDPCQYMNSLRH